MDGRRIHRPPFWTTGRCNRPPPAVPAPAKTGPSARRARKFIWPSIRWAICLPALEHGITTRSGQVPRGQAGFRAATAPLGG
jgi:hypothetical protein